MSDRSLRNRVERLKALEQQRKETEKQIEVLQAEIKQEMQARGADEATVGDWMVRFKAVISSRFNAKSFAADHPRLYKKYMAESQSMRFTVTETV